LRRPSAVTGIHDAPSPQLLAAGAADGVDGVDGVGDVAMSQVVPQRRTPSSSVAQSAAQLRQSSFASQ
jgi:hypothetical protein